MLGGGSVGARSFEEQCCAGARAYQNLDITWRGRLFFCDSGATRCESPSAVGSHASGLRFAPGIHLPEAWAELPALRGLRFRAASINNERSGCVTAFGTTGGRGAFEGLGYQRKPFSASCSVRVVGALCFAARGAVEPLGSRRGLGSGRCPIPHLGTILPANQSPRKRSDWANI